MIETMWYVFLVAVVFGAMFRRQIFWGYLNAKALYALVKEIDAKIDCCRVHDLVIDGKKYDYIYFNTERGTYIIPVDRTYEINEKSFSTTLFFNQAVSINGEEPVRYLDLYVPAGHSCEFTAASVGASRITIKDSTDTHNIGYKGNEQPASVASIIKKYGPPRMITDY